MVECVGEYLGMRLQNTERRTCTLYYYTEEEYYLRLRLVPGIHTFSHVFLGLANQKHNLPRNILGRYTCVYTV